KFEATKHAKLYDEIKVWKTARTASQIQQSMNSCQDPNESDLIFYNSFSNKVYASYGMRWFEASKGSSVSVLNDNGFIDGHTKRNSSCEPYLDGTTFSNPFTIHVLNEPIISNSIEYFESENYDSCNGEQVVL